MKRTSIVSLICVSVLVCSSGSAFAAGKPAAKTKTSGAANSAPITQPAPSAAPKTTHSAPNYSNEAPSYSSSGSRSYYVGANLGLASVSNGGGSRFGWGVDAAYKFMPTFGAGVYFLSSSKEIVTGSSSTIHNFGASGDYFFEGEVEGLRAGVLLGIANTRASSGAFSASSSDFEFGPRVGYDYQVGSDGLTVGADAGILFVTSTVSYSVLHLLANVKYWF